MMKSHASQHRAMLLALILLFLALISMAGGTALAADSNDQTTSDLSRNNRDEAVKDAGSEKGSENLATTNWDEDEEEKEASKTDGDNPARQSWEEEEEGEKPDSGEGLQMMKQEDIDRLESRERTIHFFGFLLFIGYILGGILTAFITRKQKIATALPPELLILLHTVWPLELILIPVFGKTVR